MRMPSTKSTFRRDPQQPRAERRVLELLEAAGAVMAEDGYEGATMTGIAQRAGTSIGTLYQYFPHKEAIMLALRDQYAATMDERWGEIEVAAEHLSVGEIADRFVLMAGRFAEEHPALFLVLDAPVTVRQRARRIRLRERVAKVLRLKQAGLSQELACRIANIAVQMVKGMTVLLAAANANERTALVEEYRALVAAYLRRRLDHGPEPRIGSGSDS